MRKKTPRPTTRSLDWIAAATKANAYVNCYAGSAMPVCDMIISAENAIARRHDDAFHLQRRPFHSGLIDAHLRWVDVEDARSAMKKKGTAWA